MVALTAPSLPPTLTRKKDAADDREALPDTAGVCNHQTDQHAAKAGRRHRDEAASGPPVREPVLCDSRAVLYA